MKNIENPFEGWEVISTYTRAQALEDGTLVDVSELAKEAGFLYPVAVTHAVHCVLNPSSALERQGQSFAGRAWDMFFVLRVAIRSMHNPGDDIRFSPLFVPQSGGRPEPLALRSVCGPGDNAEPVITIMLPHED